MDDVIRLCQSCLDEIIIVCNRYRVLCINQYLQNYLAGETPLHGKLNDIIKPILNALKDEAELYFQENTAKILVYKLMPAL